jgi:hypothetical protein
MRQPNFNSYLTANAFNSQISGKTNSLSRESRLPFPFLQELTEDCACTCYFGKASIGSKIHPLQQWLGGGGMIILVHADSLKIALRYAEVGQ